MATKSGSVDPSKFTEEIFDLYSIPAFDRGEPEIVAGSGIGSAKQVVQPGDVLLSKIVPHIRRSWIVGKERGRRIIASGEWIVFRNERANPDYLRQVLVGDPFHAQFMNTVVGVGGSLLRARPAHVAKIVIPLPPLAEQRRIAEVLDRAEALRAKRRAALAQLDALTQSLFLDLFGDPATNPKGWPMSPLAEVCSIVGQYGSGVPAIEFSPLRPRYVRITDIDTEGNLAPDLVSPGGTTADWSDLKLENGDVLFARSGATVGKTYKYSLADGDCVFAGYLIRFRTLPTKLLPEVLFHFTRSEAYLRWVVARQRVVAQPNINAKQYGMELSVPLPPIELQREFARRVTAVEALKTAQRASLAELDALFATLQHRAFKGEL
jgi:type I restriction enzyme S subunit